MSRFTFSLGSIFFFCAAFALAVFIFGTLPAILILKVVIASVVVAGILMTLENLNYLKGPTRPFAIRFMNSLIGCDFGVCFSVMAIFFLCTFILNGKLDLFVAWGYGIRVGAGLGFLIGLLAPVKEAKAE